MYRKGMITLNQVNDLRNDERVVVYTNNREDKSVALATKKTNNQEFINYCKMSMCRLFFDAALSQFKETTNNVVFFAYKKHLTCIVSYLFVWYHSFIIFI